MRGKNVVTLMGNLAEDPEQKRFEGSRSLVSFRLGVTESYRKNGESHEATEWINVKCWGEGLNDFIMKNLGKGDRVYVEGKFKTDKYDKNGTTVYTSYVVVSGFDGSRVDLMMKAGQQRGASAPREGAGQPSQQRSRQQQPAAQPSQQQSAFDDEIPF